MEIMTDTNTGPQIAGLGSVLAGRYRLEHCVGRGGMADVYRAQDELLHRTVAVKLFRVDAAQDTERRRIDAEMRTLAGLRHRGLVTLFDASATGDESSGQAPYLIMECIDGETLRSRIAAGPLPPAEVAAIGAELASSLRYVHASGVVHRDIKPANILLDAPDDGTSTPSAKLTDFGIARLAESAHLTELGSTVGTANYVSPEQARGKPIGPASDVYSLGLVLIECLTGQIVYPGTGVEAAVARLNQPAPVPEQFGPDWFQLLSDMTAQDPDARPSTDHVVATLTALSAGQSSVDPNAATLAVPLAAVREAAASAGPAQAQDPSATTVLPAVAPPPVGAARPHRPGRRFGVLGAAIAAVVALIVILAVILSSSEGSPSSLTPAAQPSYAAAAGPLGTHLRALEATLTGGDAALPQLRLDVRDLAAAAAAGNFADARSALRTLQLDVAAAHAAGTLADNTLARVRAAMTPLAADITQAAAAASRVAATTSPAHATHPRTTTKAPAPAPAPPHDKKKHGKGEH
jgi:tRNA A-37 threonylcarbamoyl transferase component Bud32